MGVECWTIRYGPARRPPTPLTLRAPLTRSWTYKPKGSALGFVRTGDGAVFTNVGGKGWVSRIDLLKGTQVWADPEKQSAALICRWGSDLLVFGGNDRLLRGLDPVTGEVRWKRQCLAGLDDSFVVENILVGKLGEQFHAINLNSFEYLWQVPRLVSNPLVSDGQVLIRADDDVTCYDLRSGTARWTRSGAELGYKAHQMGFIWRDWFVVRVGKELPLTAFDLATGKTLWRADFGVQWYQPHGDRVYGFTHKGVYMVLDLASGKVIFEREVGRDVPPVTGEKKGLMVARSEGQSWRGTVVEISETHAFLQTQSGQIVVLGRESGEVEQVVEIDGMPASQPVIYENRLLLTDFNACVYCFEGAS